MNHQWKYQGENEQCHTINEIEVTYQKEKNKWEKRKEDKHYSIGMRPTHSQQQGIYRLVWGIKSFFSVNIEHIVKKFFIDILNFYLFACIIIISTDAIIEIEWERVTEYFSVLFSIAIMENVNFYPLRKQFARILGMNKTTNVTNAETTKKWKKKITIENNNNNKKITRKHPKSEESSDRRTFSWSFLVFFLVVDGDTFYCSFLWLPRQFCTQFMPFG